MADLPKISKRYETLPSSPTLALNAKAKELSSRGVKVANLTVGEPDFATPSLVVDAAIASLRSGRTKYGASGGGLALRKAICEKLKRDQQIDFTPGEIVVGIGAKEVLFHIALALLEEGDEVLIPAPYWVSYPTHCQAAGAKPVAIPMASSADHFCPDPADIEKHATSKTRAIILNSPNNPAGYVWSQKQLRTLGEYLQKKNWWIISDEIYEYMSFDVEHVSMLSLFPSLRDRFILINGLSKGFAMTGWRVGYAAAPRRLISVLENMQSQSSTCLPGFIEDAAVVALNAGKSLCAEGMQALRARRDRLVERLKTLHPTVEFVQPQGAFYLYFDLRKNLENLSRAGIRTSMEFAEVLLEKYHVAMVPGEAFGTPGFLRMSYAAAEDEVMRGADAVGELVLI